MKINEIKNCCNVDLDELKRLKNELSNLYDDDELNQRTEIFKALADPTRLQILYLLQFRDLYVCEVMGILDKPQSTTSHHLNVLKNVGLIKSSKEGIWTLYGLKNPDIISLVDNLCEPVQMRSRR
jgi:ArsR family transcriptional regulator, lead/cadmium/zinc/bismuth-responsive transcriptional repressor